MIESTPSPADPPFAVAFDFDSRQHRTIEIDAIGSLEDHVTYWVDLDVLQCADTESVLRQLGIESVAINQALSSQLGGRYDTYENLIHFTVSVEQCKEGRFEMSLVDVFVGERFLITLRRGEVTFIQQMRLNYAHFFLRFAESIGFLLFDVWDGLIGSYRKSVQRCKDDVEQLQAGILEDADEELFNRVGDVMHDVLMLRKNLVANLEVLEQLAGHKTEFISSTTQPYLTNMVGALDRLSNHLAVEREVLVETLNLHLGIVTHRTNMLLNRLTIISMIFLPLTFLCGVYGMNFRHIPELDWPLGYLYFWALAIAASSGLLLLMKLKKWI